MPSTTCARFVSSAYCLFKSLIFHDLLPKPALSTAVAPDILATTFAVSLSLFGTFSRVFSANFWIFT